MNLVDTNVVSEVRRSRGDARVKARFHALGNDIRLSVVVLGEIRYGIALQPDPGLRIELNDWYEGLLSTFAHSILPITQPVAEIWGETSARLRAAGRAIDVPDGLIAATALHHDLTLWTRNTRDFAGTGVRLFDPWET